MKITTEDNLENSPICGEGTPGGTVRCACCQRQLDIEKMTEADYRAYEAYFPSVSTATQLPLITYTLGVKAVSDMLTQPEQQR
ncbi:TPA: hypothetical protein ONC18_004932 [Enterobacter kobei]|nr:hypothetical protein [Enterobacter kobei]HDS8886945.1 hypothetical protein [Enterobacter hormaechei subsp. steigerwaltii]